MRCVYAMCKSDSRYLHKAYMKNVAFIPFPKPDHYFPKCQKWVNACGSAGFTVHNITRNTYICTKHFVGGQGPTKEWPDPLVFGREEANRHPNLPHGELSTSAHCYVNLVNITDILSSSDTTTQASTALATPPVQCSSSFTEANILPPSLDKATTSGSVSSADAKITIKPFASLSNGSGFTEFGDAETSLSIVTASATLSSSSSTGSEVSPKTESSSVTASTVDADTESKLFEKTGCKSFIETMVGDKVPRIWLKRIDTKDYQERILKCGKQRGKKRKFEEITTDLHQLKKSKKSTNLLKLNTSRFSPPKRARGSGKISPMKNPKLEREITENLNGNIETPNKKRIKQKLEIPPTVHDDTCWSLAGKKPTKIVDTPLSIKSVQRAKKKVLLKSKSVNKMHSVEQKTRIIKRTNPANIIKMKRQIGKKLNNSRRRKETKEERKLRIQCAMLPARRVIKPNRKLLDFVTDDIAYGKGRDLESSPKKNESVSEETVPVKIETKNKKSPVKIHMPKPDVTPAQPVPFVDPDDGVISFLPVSLKQVSRFAKKTKTMPTPAKSIKSSKVILVKQIQAPSESDFTLAEEKAATLNIFTKLTEKSNGSPLTTSKLVKKSDLTPKPVLAPEKSKVTSKSFSKFVEKSNETPKQAAKRKRSKTDEQSMIRTSTSPRTYSQIAKRRNITSPEQFFNLTESDAFPEQDSVLLKRSSASLKSSSEFPQKIDLSPVSVENKQASPSLVSKLVQKSNATPKRISTPTKKSNTLSKAISQQVSNLLKNTSYVESPKEVLMKTNPVANIKPASMSSTPLSTSVSKYNGSNRKSVANSPLKRINKASTIQNVLDLNSMCDFLNQKTEFRKLLKRDKQMVPVKTTSALNFDRLLRDLRSIRLPPSWKIKLVASQATSTVLQLVFTNKKQFDRRVTFTRGSMEYKLIVEGFAVVLLGAPKTFDTSNDVSILLDIVSTINKRDPVLEYIRRM